MFNLDINHKLKVLYNYMVCQLILNCFLLLFLFGYFKVNLKLLHNMGYLNTITLPNMYKDMYFNVI